MCALAEMNAAQHGDMACVVLDVLFNHNKELAITFLGKRIFRVSCCSALLPYFCIVSSAPYILFLIATVVSAL